MQDSPENKPSDNQPPQPVITAVRKRQQIQDTNKRIFVWLAVSSIIVSICLVAIQFLLREFMFNQKIINKKGQTNSTLVNNLKQAETLRSNVNALLANTNLNSLRYEAPNTKTTALNVVLDALPVDGDATAFYNSLQAVVLPRSGVGIRELNTSAAQQTIADSSTDPSAAGVSSQPSMLPFTAGFDGKYADVQRALGDMSRVIRPINLTELQIRSTDNEILRVTVTGNTYYLPGKTVEVRMETMKP